MKAKTIIRFLIAAIVLIVIFLLYLHNLGPKKFKGRTVKYHSELNKHAIKYEVHGIDVSKHQGIISWEKVQHFDRTKKIDFVFIRSTSGLNKDHLFNINWNNARHNNFKIGAYHYYLSDKNSTLQALNFINTVTLKKGDLPPVLDVEKLPIVQSKQNWLKGLKNWISIIEKYYNAKPIIYTGDKFYRYHLKNDPFFNDYPRLWIANYNNVRNPSGDWAFWQYSDKVKMPGVSHRVDVNVYKYDLMTFNKLLIE